MHLRPDEPQQIARLLGFLQHGEWLARDVAAKQARLAEAPALRRFFAMQSRQEAFHAAVFQGAAHWLAPRGIRPAAPAPLAHYRAEIEAALAHGDLAESLLALQVLFEALGDVVLHAIDAGIERRGGGFTRLRQALRAQEQAHHAFGVLALDRLIADGRDSMERLRKRSDVYRECIDHMFRELTELFARFDENPADYRRLLHHRLPAWVRPA
ncbi:MAG: hypothetical protein EPN55_02860 [Gammaproteobacteria bacterium]|nr:MAG: hypothetical protein EPN55_02860 [Gammaproteobacteria bacterium]